MFSGTRTKPEAGWHRLNPVLTRTNPPSPKHGEPLRCAGSLSTDGTLVYAAKAEQLWQWPTEWVGHVRTLHLPSDGMLVQQMNREIPSAFTRFYALAPAAKVEDAQKELKAGGLTVNSARFEIQTTLTTLSASPPLFRISGLISRIEVDDVYKAAQPALATSKVAIESAKKRELGRKINARRMSSESWLHGHNDPRNTRSQVPHSGGRFTPAPRRFRRYAHRRKRREHRGPHT